MSHDSKNSRTYFPHAGGRLRGPLAAAALAGGLVAATGAQAGDVYWSVGVSSPGVHMGVASAPPVVVHPAPVVVQAAPPVGQGAAVVVYPGQPVRQVVPAAPVVIAPPVYYYAQPRVVYAPRYWPGPGWRHGHGYGRRDWR